MASSITISKVTGGGIAGSQKLNENLTTLAEAVESCLGRGGTSESNNTMQGSIDMGGHRITGLAVPQSNTDAVSKKYVSELISDTDTSSGIIILEEIITLTAGQTVVNLVELDYTVGFNEVSIGYQSSGTTGYLTLSLEDEEYEETSSTVITLAFSASSGDKLRIVKNEPISTTDPELIPAGETLIEARDTAVSAASSASSSASAASASAASAAQDADDAAEAASIAEGIAATIGDASTIDYDNTTSGLTSTDVQGAIDELSDGKQDYLGTGTSDQFLRWVSGAPAWDTYRGLFHVRESYTAGTAGGTSLSAAWQARSLNTTVLNSITGASLVNYTITLPIGTYDVFGYSMVNLSNCAFSGLYSITDASYILRGATHYAHNPSTVYAITSAACLICGRITFTQATQLSFQVYTQTAYATYGLGYPSSLADEIYAELMLCKL